MDFEVMDISGDVGLKAYGARAEEAFVNAGAGMYNLVTDPAGVDEKRSLEVAIEADTPEALLVGYLNELIYHFDTDGFIGKRIEVTALDLGPAPAVTAKVYGEEFDPERHERKLLIKAATYHMVKVGKSAAGWEINVVFDI